MLFRSLCDVWANIADLENTSYSFEKKKRQVIEKQRYLDAIMPQIIRHKTKYPGLVFAQKDLEELLSYYGKEKRF